MADREEILKHAYSMKGLMGNNEIEFLFDTCADPHINTVVEIGSWCGKSTYTIAHALNGLSAPGERWTGHLFAVDPHTDIYTTHGFNGENSWACFLDVVKKLDNVSVLRMNSHAASMYLPGLVDLVFIDGSHKYEAVALDARVWGERANKLVFHDYVPNANYGRDVQKAVGEMLASGWTEVKRVGSTVLIQR